jgi:hypothetical protein
MCMIMSGMLTVQPEDQGFGVRLRSRWQFEVRAPGLHLTLSPLGCDLEGSDLW